MAITFDHEPDARTAWQNFHRHRRIDRRAPRGGGSAMLITLLAGLGFWVVLAYGLSLAL